MATATVVSASSEDFSSALTFSLGQLKLPGLSLKEEQRAAIKAVYEGKDVFVSLPTGYGKSLCYQTLPFVLSYKQARTSSAVIVMSPLIALMEDQVSGLKRRGVKASITSSDSVTKEHICTEEGLATDNLFFCSPEVLATSKRNSFDRLEFSGRVVALVVDEAHCVSKW